MHSLGLQRCSLHYLLLPETHRSIEVWSWMGQIKWNKFPCKHSYDCIPFHTWRKSIGLDKKSMNVCYTVVFDSLKKIMAWGQPYLRVLENNIHNECENTFVFCLGLQPSEWKTHCLNEWRVYLWVKLGTYFSPRATLEPETLLEVRAKMDRQNSSFCL